MTTSVTRPASASSRPASARRSRSTRSRRRDRSPALAAGDEVQHGARDDRADDLRDDVRQQLRGGEAPARAQPDRHGGIEVAAGDRPSA